MSPHISNIISLDIGASAMPPTVIGLNFNSWLHVELIAIQLFALPLKRWDRLEYSLTSLENSEFLLFSSLNGVSYSTILPAHHEQYGF
jgi:hypothetical protein